MFKINKQLKSCLKSNWVSKTETNINHNNLYLQMFALKGQLAAYYIQIFL